MEDEEYFDYIMDEMGITDPYSIEEAEDLYTIITDIISMK